MSDEAQISEVNCEFVEPPYVKERFILVAVIGTTVAVINIVENLLLCFMFFSKKSYRSSHCLYLALLAFFDVCIAGAYIPLMSLNLTVDYTQSVPLLRAWFSYMKPMITISHIAMTSSTFATVAASFERFCITVKPKYTKTLNKNRVRIAIASVVLGVLCKFTQAIEITVEYVPDCAGTMGEWTLELSSLATNELYKVFWRIWFRSIITIILPFTVLTLMNIKIVLRMQRNEFQFLSAQKLTDAKRKQRVRAATRTLVFVVLTYLMTNFLNVIITIWEYIDSDSLQNDYGTFYMFAVDSVSLMTIMAGALRLPIYITCQSELRKELCRLIKGVFGGSQYNYTASTASTALTKVDSFDKDDDEDPRGAYPNLFFKLGTVLLVEPTRKSSSSHNES